MVVGSLALRNHLALRDLLRSDTQWRDEYADVKRQVAATAIDIYEYGAGKNETVQRILAAAGLSEAERASINANNVPVTRRKH